MQAGAVLSEEPVVINLRLYRGDTQRLSLRFLDDSTGEPIDLSTVPGGWNFESQIRSNQDRTVILAEFDVDNSDGDVGELVLTLQPGSSALLAEEAYWDLQGTHPVQGTKTLVMGTVWTTKDVTR